MWFIALLLGPLAFPVGTAAAATSPAQAIALLNAQRAANGIPAGITENTSWDVACQNHNAWTSLNPNAANPHDETPGTPGYTTDGAWAGRTSVLVTGGAQDWAPTDAYPWGATNPWENAPFHLMQLLAPDLSVTGFDESTGDCMVTLDGYQRPPPSGPELLTYPGNGTSFIPASETANEWPSTPGEQVGIPQGTTTGPYLYVLGWDTGPGNLTSASLSGPSGPVAIDTAGANTPDGGMIIPIHPLTPGANYTASVTFTPFYPAHDGNLYGPQSLTWSVSVARAAPSLTAGIGGDHVTATSESPAPITAVITRLPSNTTVTTLTVPSGASVPLNLPGAQYQACFSQLATSQYLAAGPACHTNSWRSTPSLSLGRVQRVSKGRKLQVGLTTALSLAGATAELTVGPSTGACARVLRAVLHGSQFPRLRYYHRTFALNAAQTLTVPASQKRQLLTVCVGPTSVGDFLYGAGQVAKELAARKTPARHHKPSRRKPAARP